MRRAEVGIHHRGHGTLRDIRHSSDSFCAFLLRTLDRFGHQLLARGKMPVEASARRLWGRLHSCHVWCEILQRCIRYSRPLSVCQHCRVERQVVADKAQGELGMYVRPCRLIYLIRRRFL